MDEVLRHLRAITGGRTLGGRDGECVAHRVLVLRGLDADGDLAVKLKRARQAGYLRSSGRGRNRSHRLTAAGRVRAGDTT